MTYLVGGVYCIAVYARDDTFMLLRMGLTVNKFEDVGCYYLDGERTVVGVWRCLW